MKMICHVKTPTFEKESVLNVAHQSILGECENFLMIAEACKLREDIALEHLVRHQIETAVSAALTSVNVEDFGEVTISFRIEK